MSCNPSDLSMPEQDDAVANDLAIHARCMTGLWRQLAEAARFIPVLIVGIAVGFAGLIVVFSQASSSPSLIGGLIAIFWFACSPIVAFAWYLRWKSRPGAADTELHIRDDGLEVVALREGVPSIFIPWGQFTRCRKRPLAGLHFSLSITAHTDAGPLHRFAAEYTLCGSFHHATRFTQELENRVESRRG